MFISKQEITQALKDEGMLTNLTPKNREFFLEYCINGHDALQAYLDTMVDESSGRTNKFPGEKANEIVAKQEFRECFEVYVELLKDIAGVKTNSSIFNVYQVMAFYNPLDYLDDTGQFKYTSIDEAKEQLGIKALAIKSIDLSVHPRDPKAVLRTITFVDRFKSLKELQRFSKFIDEAESGGEKLGNITIDLGNEQFSIESENKRRQELNIVEKE